MKVIKKYPASFVMLIGWELFGLSGLLAVWEAAWQDWYMSMVGLMFIVGVAIFASGVIFGIIRAIVRLNRKKNGVGQNSTNYVDDLAMHYMTNSQFNTFYWIMVIVLSPILPILLVHVLDVFMAGVMIINLGFMIWMLIVRKDVIINRFYKVRNADKYFSYESVEAEVLLDSFYGDYIHVYRAEDWDEKMREFICSMLRRESRLGKNIKCCSLSKNLLDRKYNYEYNSYFGDLMMIPFGQFEINEKNGAKIKNYFDRLSIVRYTDLVNYKYQSKKSLDTSDYAYTNENIALRPFVSNVESVEFIDSDIRIAFRNACEVDNQWKRYYNCMLVLKDAKLLDGDDITIDKNSYTESYSIDEEKKIIEITIVTEPDDDVYIESDEEYFDSMRKVFRCRYETAQWYWDGFCDMSKTEEIFSRITPKENESK